MPLSSEERRILADIEAHLAADSPGLEERLSGTRPARRGRVAAAAGAMARHCGMWLLCAPLTAAAGVGMGTLGAGLRERPLVQAGIALLSLAAAALVATVVAGAVAAREPPER
jgi:hypothetical protein